MLTGGGDEAAIARGIFDTYTRPQPALLADGAAHDVGGGQHRTNLPAEIKISAIDGDAYKFLFMAKGGGSANKSYLFQETKALLNPTALLAFLDEKLRTLGTAACPPYHLAVVIGGTSAEFALETAKLALDPLPRHPPDRGQRRSATASATSSFEAEVLALTPGLRHRRAVRRQVLLPRRAGHPPAAPRRVVPGGDRGVAARPTARRSARSPPKASSSSSSRPTRPSTCPRSPTSTCPTTSCTSTSSAPWTRSAPSCPSTRSRPGSR